MKVSVDVRPCTEEDMSRLRAQDLAQLDLRHHEERWTTQQNGEALYLLAWQGNVVVGRVTVLFRSKYAEIRNLLGGKCQK